MRLITSRLAVLCHSVAKGEQRIIKGLLDRGHNVVSIAEITDPLILIDADLILLTIIKNEIKLQADQQHNLLQIINPLRDLISDTLAQILAQAEMPTKKSPENSTASLRLSAHCFSVANDLAELRIHCVSEVTEFLYKMSFTLVGANKEGKNLQLHAQVKQIACCLALINSAPKNLEPTLSLAQDADKLSLKPPVSTAALTIPSSPVLVISTESVMQRVDKAVIEVGIKEEQLNRIHGLLTIIEEITGDLLESVSLNLHKSTVKTNEFNVQVSARSRAGSISEFNTSQEGASNIPLSARPRTASSADNLPVSASGSDSPANARLRAASTAQMPIMKRIGSESQLNSHLRAPATTEKPLVKRNESDTHLNVSSRTSSSIRSEAIVSSESAVAVNAKSRATLISEKINHLTGFVITDLQLSKDLLFVANELLKCNDLVGVELLLRLSFIFLPPLPHNQVCTHECFIFLSMANYVCAEIKWNSESKQLSNGINKAELVNDLFARISKLLEYLEESVNRLPPDNHLARACMQLARTLKLTSPNLNVEKCKCYMFVIHFLGDEQMTMQEKISFYISALPDVLSDLTSKTAKLLSLPSKVNKIIRELNQQIAQLRIPWEFFERCKASLRDLLRQAFYELVENLCLLVLQATPAKDVDALLLLHVIRFKSLLQQKHLSKRIIAEKTIVEIAKLINDKHFIHLLHMLNTEDKNHRKKHALSELDDRTVDEEDIRLIMYLAMFKRLYGPEFNKKYLGYYEKLCNFMIDIMVENADLEKLFREHYIMLNNASYETDTESKQGFLQCCYALFSMFKMIYVDGDTSVRAHLEIQTFLSVEENKAEFLWWKNRLEEMLNAIVSGSNLVTENRWLRRKIDDLEMQVLDLKRAANLKQDTDLNPDAGLKLSTDLNSRAGLKPGTDLNSDAVLKQDTNLNRSTELKRVLKNGQTQYSQLPVLFNSTSAPFKTNAASEKSGHSIVHDEMNGESNTIEGDYSADTPDGHRRSFSLP